MEEVVGAERTMPSPGAEELVGAGRGGGAWSRGTERIADAAEALLGLDAAVNDGVRLVGLV
jgi:hypothetical protein